MRATDHGLQVNLRIPVRVIEDDHVSGCQVDTQTPRPGAQHEEELAAVGLVERVDGDLARERGARENIFTLPVLKVQPRSRRLKSFENQNGFTNGTR